MKIRAVLFDLDDTLLVDQAWVAEALLLACQPAAERGVEPAGLAATLRERCRTIWRAAPSHAYCLRLGISSSEGLVSDLPGRDGEGRGLTAWLPEYRRRAWTEALAAHGVADAGLASTLAETYRRVRRSRYRLLDAARPLLAGLRGRPGLKLGLVTNGPSDLQHEKIDRTGLDGLVDVVVVSGDVGAGKPDPAVFDHALGRLGGEPASSIMVGDSLERDVAGAAAAGLASLWIGDADELPDGAVPTLVAPDLAAAGDLLPRIL